MMAFFWVQKYNQIHFLSTTDLYLQIQVPHNHNLLCLIIVNLLLTEDIGGPKITQLQINIS